MKYEGTIIWSGCEHSVVVQWIRCPRCVIESLRTEVALKDAVISGYEQLATEDGAIAAHTENRRLLDVVGKAHDELMNLQPCIGQLPKEYRLFIDPHVGVAMGILKPTPRCEHGEGLTDYCLPCRRVNGGH